MKKRIFFTSKTFLHTDSASSPFETIVPSTFVCELVRKVRTDGFPDSIDDGPFFLLPFFSYSLPPPYPFFEIIFFSTVVVGLVRTALFLPGIGVEKPDPRHALHWAFFLSQLSAPPIILGLRLLLWARSVSWQVDRKRSFWTESSRCLQTVLYLLWPIHVTVSVSGRIK